MKSSIGHLKSVIAECQRQRACGWRIWAACFVAPLLGMAAQKEFPAGQVEFFESRVRPVLVESCYPCHSAQSGKSKGGLRLDTRAGWREGGDSGPALVPGQPDASRLIKAIRYTDEDLAMPPASKGGKLAARKIADLVAWVKLGAPDPRTGRAASPLAGASAARTPASHWAFQPVVTPAKPTVRRAGWVQTPVDAFVLAKLEARRLEPAPRAEPRTLIRRVYYDLVGLPPSAAEVEAFVDDATPEAFAQVVERLLASPRYGERWGRYWLDVARYADTKGYVFQEERRYPFSYTYRDYVIQSFNADKPYDQFLREQIAADQLALGEDKSALAALGFLTLGRRFLNNPDDIIDDRIDVVTRGTLALTVACARCHDHKFDPIPTEDYYALHGIFSSSEEPREKPLLGRLRETPEHRDYLKQKGEIETKIQAATQKEVRQFLSRERARAGDYLLAAHDAQSLRQPTSLETFAGERKVTLTLLRRWMAFLNQQAKAPGPVLAPWFAFATLPEADFAAAAGKLTSELAAGTCLERPVNPVLAKALAPAPPKSLPEIAGRYNTIFAQVESSWKTALEQARKANRPYPTALADAGEEAVRQFLHAEHAPANLPAAEVERLIGRRIRNQTVQYRRQMEALDWQHPGAPRRAMVLVDKAQPHNSHIHIRGRATNPGREVPRRFLAVLSGPDRPSYHQGSGRLELARDIASRDNPLTARVLVNRVWGWHFGQGLVRTASDFGTRVEAPAQLDLLNWLAATFMNEGWSVKQLHRHILLSATYQQASTGTARQRERDPENQWLSRYHRQRLDFEALRDTLLAISGRLDLRMGGLPVDIIGRPFSGRRTVYGFIDRQNLPGLFRTFDFPMPDATSPGRFHTTVPQQALYMLNSPFVLEQARHLVKREELQTAKGEAEKLAALFRLVFQRQPAPEEMAWAKRYLQAQSKQMVAASPVWQYGSARFDADAGATKDFRRFTQFTPKTGWHAEEQFPGPGSGWVMVNAHGGHPGGTPKLASVRRWTAPLEGVVDIAAALQHGSEQGDGVRGRIVSSRQGLLGEWTVRNSHADTSLKRVSVGRGEVIDFMVDCVTNEHFDSYDWAPTIRYVAGQLERLRRTQFVADRDFGGPESSRMRAPLSGWEKFAQVLLLSNELAFVD